MLEFSREITDSYFLSRNLARKLKIQKYLMKLHCQHCFFLILTFARKLSFQNSISSILDTHLISRSLKIQIYPALIIGSSGSKCLKMYIRVFSIIANKSGLSSAHFISQTSFLSNRISSPSRPPPEWICVSSRPPPWLPSRSKNCKSPVTSMIDRHLKSKKYKTERETNEKLDPKMDQSWHKVD